MDTIKIEDKEYTLEEVKEGLRLVKEKKSKGRRWKPAPGQLFWFISNGDIFNTQWSGSLACQRLYAIGNYYKTEEDAEAALDALKVHQELKDIADFEPNWENDSKWKYHLVYDHESEEVCTDCYSWVQAANTVYFRSDKEAYAAVDKVGRDRVINYLTRT